MGIHYKTGNLLDAPVDYICHQVNCQGRMASGIAKQIRDRWPIVYEQYMAGINERRKKVEELCGQWESQIDVSETLLGHGQNIPVSDNLTVINMFSQQYYGYDGKKYTSYDAFWDCLQGIALTVPKGSKIGFPYKIGCGLGGASWPVIFQMIDEVLGEDFQVYIYMLEENNQ
jgi:O-acetyl-ADP-ribose deacetylase (regulator of RNase III)